mmetsp:Transcript_79028/g.226553  ORF Transcript_79028/g.226553 Transcript_79028/m.226553 type:complete len:205 (+) Transcript_79028:404-1018(+)
MAKTPLQSCLYWTLRLPSLPRKHWHYKYLSARTSRRTFRCTNSWRSKLRRSRAWMGMVARPPLRMAPPSTRPPPCPLAAPALLPPPVPRAPGAPPVGMPCCWHSCCSTLGCSTIMFWRSCRCKARRRRRCCSQSGQLPDPMAPRCRRPQAPPPHQQGPRGPDLPSGSGSRTRSPCKSPRRRIGSSASASSTNWRSSFPQSRPKG